MNRVLIITYYWPPGAGAGVQRWLKFSKYLPLHGWEPVILTVDPAFAQYPSLDESLLHDIPENIKIVRTPARNYFRFAGRERSQIPSAGFASEGRKSFLSYLMRFARGNFFIPDPRRGWNPYAFREACKLIEKENITRVITSSPPHSTQLIGLKLKKKYPHIKWIADLRDPWTDIYYYKEFFHTYPARLLDRHYEKSVLRKADKIITVGDRLKIMLASKVSTAEAKTYVITNGYDDEDFRNLKPSEPEIFTISYIGTLSPAYPLKGFAEAVKKLTDSGRKIRVRFVGTISSTQKKTILENVPEEFLDFIPYVSHTEAVKHMISSSALLLIIPDHPGNRCILTGKLFEYIASGKPVLCLGPADGDAALVLEMTGAGITTGYKETNTIARIISDFMEKRFIPSKEKTEIFSRYNLTRKIAEIIK
ncbi:MAG TPA: glycosyltransferase [Bacteroidales bacterium]|nr:glycosyltransferase [Bacteroidales bacterium]